MLLPCTCLSEFQDKTYGRGMRVHSPRVKGRDFKGWRCTVCSTTHEGPKPEASLFAGAGGSN